MANIIKQIVKADGNSTSTYDIGASSNYVFVGERSLTDKLDDYALGSTLANYVSTSSLASTLDNYAPASTLTNYTPVSNFNASTARFNGFIGNLASSPSSTSNWGSKIIVETVNNNATTSKVSNNDTLAILAGKLNYLRTHPFAIITYRTTDHTAIANGTYMFTFSTASPYQIHTATGTVSTSSLSKYSLIYPINTEVRIGAPSDPGLGTQGNYSGVGGPLIPQRAFFSNNGKGITVALYNTKSSNVNFNTLSVHVLAIQK